jgi:hypothetical protein
MGGGLMQLVAYGAQDIYLTGNPQITFFKVVYRRHTNFSMEAIQQTFAGDADYGNKVSCTISRNGDLVHRMYLEHDAAFRSVTNAHEIGVCSDYGSHVMKSTEIEIGGQMIDRHYGEWHSVYSHLTEPNPIGLAFGGVVEQPDYSLKGTLFQRMTGNNNGTECSPSSTKVAEHNVGGWLITDPGSVKAKASGKFFIPLYFWFCRNPGLALPLIALQYHEVKVKITFEKIVNLVLSKNDGDFSTGAEEAEKDPDLNNSFKLWCDYIYLDTDERRRFAQVSHEYLIEQIQYETKSENSMELFFNHPVKELIWTGVRKFDTTNGLTDGPKLYARRELVNTDTFKLVLNGHDRFEPRDTRYFTRTQVWQNHTGYGDTQTTGDTIAVYSFALKPEEHQPSGTCNFSRIDSAYLIRTGTPTDINVYAVNYNVLRIMSGMGGLAYSN